MQDMSEVPACQNQPEASIKESLVITILSSCEGITAVKFPVGGMPAFLPFPVASKATNGCLVHGLKTVPGLPMP